MYILSDDDDDGCGDHSVEEERKETKTEGWEAGITDVSNGIGS